MSIDQSIALHDSLKEMFSKESLPVISSTLMNGGWWKKIMKNDPHNFHALDFKKVLGHFHSEVTENPSEMHEKSRVQTGSLRFPLNRRTLFHTRIKFNSFKTTDRPHFFGLSEADWFPDWCFWKLRNLGPSDATLNMLFEMKPWIGCFANRAFSWYQII